MATHITTAQQLGPTFRICISMLLRRDTPWLAPLDLLRSLSCDRIPNTGDWDLSGAEVLSAWCMHRLYKSVNDTTTATCRTCSVVFSSWSFSLRCVGVMGAYSTTSSLPGSALSTSVFTRRSRKGFRMECSFVTTCA